MHPLLLLEEWLETLAEEASPLYVWSVLVEEVLKSTAPERSLPLRRTVAAVAGGGQG